MGKKLKIGQWVWRLKRQGEKILTLPFQIQKTGTDQVNGQQTVLVDNQIVYAQYLRPVCEEHPGYTARKPPVKWCDCCAYLYLYNKGGIE
jgi:hypothetical protein